MSRKSGAIHDEAVERIRDGSITGVAYDPQTARLVSEGAIKA